MNPTLLLIYSLCLIFASGTFYYLTTNTEWSLLASVILSCCIGYLPVYLNTSYLSYGMPWKWFRHWKLWTRLFKFLDAKITLETPLDPKQLYLFCNFPHGFSKFKTLNVILVNSLNITVLSDECVLCIFVFCYICYCYKRCIVSVFVAA